MKQAKNSEFLCYSYHIQDLGVEGLANAQTFTDQLDFKDLEHRPFILSTCNRVDLVFEASALDLEFTKLKEPAHPLKRRCYTGLEATLRHLLSVALSDDSVVFGENQIMGQIKSALTLQKSEISPNLFRVLEMVLRESKKIRSEFQMSQFETSVSSVAAKIIAQHIKKLKGGKDSKTILFVGSGETNQLVARSLLKRNIDDFIWVNRTASKAAAAAKNFKGAVAPWSAIERAISTSGNPVAVVCLATKSDKILFQTAQYKKFQPQLVIDLSVPKNASAKDAKKLGIEYFGMDEMTELLKERTNKVQVLKVKLQGAIDQAAGLICKEYEKYQKRHVLADVVRRSNDAAQTLFFDELPPELQKLAPKQTEALHFYTKKLVKRLNHLYLQALNVVLESERE